MKEKKERLLTDRGGMAIAGVIVLLFVLSLMGTAMYAYSMDSIKSVRFASDRKKAEYLAQAGVEATSYAYQKAVNNPEAIGMFQGFVEAAQADGNYIQSSKVYLIWGDDPSSASTSKTYYYTDTAGYTNAVASGKTVIGYYIVRIDSTSIPYEYTQTSSSSTAAGDISTTKTTLESKAKTFISTGCVIKGDDDSGAAVSANDTADIKRAKKAYIADPQQASSNYYGADGILNTSNTNFKYKQIGTFTSKSSLTLNLVHFSPITIDVGSRTSNIYVAYSAGNMILGTPTNASTVSCLTNQNNIITFIGMDKLFLRTGLNVSASDAHYNIISLKGNDIVIDGNVEITVFCIARKSSSTLWNNLSTIYQAMTGKYKLGTVIIGTPSQAGTTVTDPYKGGVYKFGECGRIYFGGDVYVNVQMLNVGTYRYKAFSAGDAYYYNDDIAISSGSTVCGIDLLKYFLDYSLATEKYSSNVLTRFREILSLYYGVAKADLDDGTGYSKYSTDVTSGSYVTATINYSGANKTINFSKDSMRKIDRDTYGDTYRSTVPPSATDSSSLVWYAD